MIDFLEDVKNPSEKVEGLPLAVALVLDLGECSFPKNYVHELLYGWSLEDYSIKRQFDVIADIILEDLIQKAWKEDENFKPSEQTARLKELVEYLAGFGSES